jgi:myo-inositol-1-phosphate synthase
VGAFGGVGTTITVGLAALARGLIDPVGLVTSRPIFDGLPLPAPADFIVGGHEIRLGSFSESADEFRRASGVFEQSWLDACRNELTAASERVRTGTTLGAGPAIASLASRPDLPANESPAAAIDRIEADLRRFAEAERLDHGIVLNVASTEPPIAPGPEGATWSDLATAIESSRSPWLPASSLYAIAAVRAGFSHINFTPSLGASLPAVEELAGHTGSVLAGKDGKTGETLMKTVLAPMFEARNLEVMSWVGHNIFGNRDAVVLDDPANKASKVTTKDRVVSGILGYKPSTLVTIEYVPDMGDWKTAWDHIHFRGFLGCKMALQFTWQGCDSFLAAPLAIDLARLVDLARQRGESGLQKHLSCFFKSPEGVDEHDFFRQSRWLDDYARAATD